ncbi:MAG: type IV toxin-antitoxin system AbiEi family antitoxin domain-containing protein [Proteobacteria bacterium]|nr:type IV toxin-antitoxin system AbiEi family antitoxin domain-containing protein [Pseudomonadota bacterium]
MKSLTEKIMESDQVNRVFSDAQLSRMLGGSDARRYGLVNRALKVGELHRVKRGLYALDNRYRDYPLHPFALAQVMVPGSYVSLETALAYHGWIPEAVFTTASILPGRKSKNYDHEKLGSFSFQPLAIHKGYFLELVLREQVNQQAILIAKPVRALMDLICLRKKEWQGMDWLTEGMRIDYEYLKMINGADIRSLKLVYKQNRIRKFLDELSRELGND